MPNGVSPFKFTLYSRWPDENDECPYVWFFLTTCLFMLGVFVNNLACDYVVSSLDSNHHTEHQQPTSSWWKGDEEGKCCAPHWVERQYGLKAQKHIAQGNALGNGATSCTPYRGKSKRNTMTAKCFCPYRTQLPQRIPVPGCCPGLYAFGLSARGSLRQPTSEGKEGLLKVYKLFVKKWGCQDADLYVWLFLTTCLFMLGVFANHLVSGLKYAKDKQLLYLVDK